LGKGPGEKYGWIALKACIGQSLMVGLLLLLYLSGDPIMAVISGGVSVVEALDVKAGSDGAVRTKWSVYVYITVFTFEASLPHLVSVQFAHT
jgi:hypothetical protein